VVVLTFGPTPALLGVVKKYRCAVCSHEYDPEKGDPDSGVAPGTPFESLPDDWFCPECGAAKSEFEPMD
jgi:rubredoxin